jgi:hypothetical protein
MSPASVPSTVPKKHRYIFPKSIEPEHLLLNLHILAFIEASRTVPLDYPPSNGRPLDTPVSKKRSLEHIVSNEDAPENTEKLTGLLQSMHKLYAMVKLLQDPAHHEIYTEELHLVAGLLAYKVPEQSELYKYLSQERREHVADQINAAILGQSVHSPCCPC